MEIEKAFSGMKGGTSDGGTTQRTLSKFLTWLSDRRNLDITVIATCNAMSLPPEFVRSQRWSTIFYLGLPTDRIKKEAWKIHIRNFELDDDCYPDDEGWTGAEIFQCCENAKILDVPLQVAADYITRVSKIAEKELGELKAFAKNAGLVPADKEDETSADTDLME